MAGSFRAELHPVVPIGDNLAHERRVVGGDVVADELGHVHEAHDLVVVAHPLVHLAELDIAHDMVERLEDPLRPTVAPDEAGGPLDIARQVRAVILRAVHEGMPGVTVRGDGTHPDRPMLVGDVLRLLQDPCAGGPCLLDAPVHVGHLEGDVDDAVAVDAVVIQQGAVCGNSTLDHEAA